MSYNYLYLIMAFTLSGCGGIPKQFYELNSKGLLSIDGEHVLVKKAWFQVDSEDYPKYKFREDVTPPEPYRTKYSLPIIKRSDIWMVKYKIIDSYLIVSNDYHNKLCEEPGYFWVDCARTRDYGIWIDEDGNITGGWKVLKGNLKRGYEALEDLTPKYMSNKNWPSLETVTNVD